MPPTIYSTKNSKFKTALRLRDGGQRRKTGTFLIDGVLEAARALDANIVFRQVFVDCGLLQSTSESEASALIRRIPSELLQPVAAEILAKLSYGERGSQIVCVAARPSLELNRLKEQSDPLLLVVDGIEKPGNLGAILRTADAAGVSAVILNNPVCEIFNPNAIRASLGTIFTIPLAEAQTNETLNFLKHLDCRVFATRVDASQAFWEADYRGSVAIVLGSEAGGLGLDWSVPACNSIAIPMLGKADSLNVSTSAAIVLFEALRQRKLMFDRPEKAV